VTAVGYPNSEGVVDEIRIGRSGQDGVAVVWRRDGVGVWHAAAPSARVALVDSARVGAANIRRLNAVAGQILTPGDEQRGQGGLSQPPGGVDRSGPNKK